MNLIQNVSDHPYSFGEMEKAISKTIDADARKAQIFSGCFLLSTLQRTSI